MKTLSAITFFVFVATAHAQSSPWNQQISCVGQDLKIQITVPSTANTGGIVMGAVMTINNQGADIPAMITVMDAGTLDIMRQDGNACALSNVSGKISGQCGLVASGNYALVSCQ